MLEIPKYKEKEVPAFLSYRMGQDETTRTPDVGEEASAFSSAEEGHGEGCCRTIGSM